MTHCVKNYTQRTGVPFTLIVNKFPSVKKFTLPLLLMLATNMRYVMMMIMVTMMILTMLMLMMVTMMILIAMKIFYRGSNGVLRETMRASKCLIPPGAHNTTAPPYKS